MKKGWVTGVEVTLTQPKKGVLSLGVKKKKHGHLTGMGGWKKVPGIWENQSKQESEIKCLWVCA